MVQKDSKRKEGTQAGENPQVTNVCTRKKREKARRGRRKIKGNYEDIRTPKTVLATLLRRFLEVNASRDLL
jgi:hypothetical protein